MTTREEWDAVAYLQHVKYIELAKAHGATGDLRVGVKMTRPDLRTYGGFRWVDWTIETEKRAIPESLRAVAAG